MIKLHLLIKTEVKGLRKKDIDPAKLVSCLPVHTIIYARNISPRT